MKSVQQRAMSWIINGEVGIKDSEEALFAAEARAAEAERQRYKLAKALADGANDCPYLTFWAESPDEKEPEWCECHYSEEDGFDCQTRDITGCWLQWSAQEDGE